MGEWGEVFLVPLRLVGIIPFVFCYVVGGRRWKWVRRFIGPVVVFLPLIAISHNLLLILPMLLLMLSLCLGYGADYVWESIRKRFFYGVCVGTCGAITGILLGNITLAIIQFVMALWGSMFFGVLNPTTAVKEEALIATFSILIYPFMI